MNKQAAYELGVELAMRDAGLIKEGFFGGIGRRIAGGKYLRKGVQQLEKEDAAIRALLENAQHSAAGAFGRGMSPTMRNKPEYAIGQIEHMLRRDAGETLVNPLERELAEMVRSAPSIPYLHEKALGNLREGLRRGAKGERVGNILGYGTAGLGALGAAAAGGNALAED
jgi:hypothetical protein